MPASSRFRSDSPATGRPVRRPRLALLPLLAGLILGCASLAAAAAGPSATPGSLGDRIHQHFRVWVEDETIRLRPIEGDPATTATAGGMFSRSRCTTTCSPAMPSATRASPRPARA